MYAPLYIIFDNNVGHFNISSGMLINILHSTRGLFGFHFVLWYFNVIRVAAFLISYGKELEIADL